MRCSWPEAACPGLASPLTAHPELLCHLSLCGSCLPNRTEPWRAETVTVFFFFYLWTSNAQIRPRLWKCAGECPTNSCGIDKLVKWSKLSETCCQSRKHHRDTMITKEAKHRAQRPWWPGQWRSWLWSPGFVSSQVALSNSPSLCFLLCQLQVLVFSLKCAWHRV